MQAGVSRSGGSFGVNSALLELDNEANDRYQSTWSMLVKQLTLVQFLNLFKSIFKLLDML